MFTWFVVALQLTSLLKKVMKQMNMEGLDIVSIDYESTGIPATAQLFKPVIYKDGTDYCCLMGPDPQKGIFGCGETPGEAVDDWAQDLEERLERQDPDDEVAAYVRIRLNSKP